MLTLKTLVRKSIGPFLKKEPPLEHTTIPFYNLWDSLL